MATLRRAGSPGWLAEPRTEGRLHQAGRLYCTSLNLRWISSLAGRLYGTSLNLRWKSPWGGGGVKIRCMIKNRLHLSPLPAVNITKHLFYLFPHISSSVEVLKIRVPMAKHSFRDNCSIVLFIP